MSVFIFIKIRENAHFHTLYVHVPIRSKTVVTQRSCCRDLPRSAPFHPLMHRFSAVVPWQINSIFIIICISPYKLVCCYIDGKSCTTGCKPICCTTRCLKGFAHFSTAKIFKNPTRKSHFLFLFQFFYQCFW